MAHIRIGISYKYKNFPFSKEATNYSKQIAFIHKPFVRFSVGIMMFAVALVLYIFTCSMLSPALQVILFIAICAGSIIVSIAILRYLDRLYLARRDAALRRDLVKLVGADGEKIFQEIKLKEAAEKTISKEINNK